MPQDPARLPSPRTPAAALTRLLAAAFEKAAALPDDDQDDVARRLPDCLDGDAKWDEPFARPESAAMLDAMADRVLADHRAGKTAPLNLGDL